MSGLPSTTQATDPCASFETDGALDVGKLLDDAVTIANCVYTEVHQLSGFWEKQIAAHVAQALVQLQRARSSHIANKTVGNPPSK